MGFSVMLWGAEKLVPDEYWCPYGTVSLIKQKHETQQTIQDHIKLENTNPTLNPNPKPNPTHTPILTPPLKVSGW